MRSQAVIKQADFLGIRNFLAGKHSCLVDDDVLQGFSQLGSSSQLTSDVVNSLEKYVVQRYCRNKVPQGIQSLADLRWWMFSKKQAESHKLPPTLEVFRQKCLRGHFMNTVWKQSHVSFQILPDPIDFGWNKDVDNLYEPVTTTLLPAQQPTIHLTVCSCKCKKNNLKCSEMCQCVDCENELVSESLNSHSIDDDLET